MDPLPGELEDKGNTEERNSAILLLFCLGKAYLGRNLYVGLCDICGFCPAAVCNSAPQCKAEGISDAFQRSSSHKILYFGPTGSVIQTSCMRMTDIS